MPSLTPPRLEHLDSALGVGVAAPRISWSVVGAVNWAQGGYEIEKQLIASERTEPVRVTVPGRERSLVSWPFPSLRSREAFTLRVRSFAEDGSVSSWSPPTVVEAGLLKESDWVAKAISSEPQSGSLRRPPIFRRGFTLGDGVAKARIYVTGHGVFDIEINGQRVGDDALAPGWTVYSKRLRYTTHDVTDLLTSGENAIGAWMGDGWYRGRIGIFGGVENLYGDDIALVAQLEVELNDGTRLTVCTDDDWRWSSSPILSSGLYEGESFDARAVPTGWTNTEFDDAGWSPVREVQYNKATLISSEAPPIRCTQELAPTRQWQGSDGSTFYDFGQNASGRLRIKLTAPAGARVRLRHAEIFENGHLNRELLRGAEATDYYVSDGGKNQTWEPRFTIHGFRFAQLSILEGDAEVHDVTFRVYHTDMTRRGHFNSSHAGLNRLHENIVWSMRSNFVGIPTDCPQRDERLGWTGDVQLFTPTAAFLYDCAGMLGGWLKDLATEQTPEGVVPTYVPVVPSDTEFNPLKPIAGWGDAAVLVPWALYQSYGDKRVLEEQYPSARAWVELVASVAGDDGLWTEGDQLGDWLDPAAPPEKSAEGSTDRYLVATAYFAHSARVLSCTALALGFMEDVAKYSAMADRVTAAFQGRWFATDGRLHSETVAGYALAIRFSMVPDYRVAGDRLESLVKESGYSATSGLIGSWAVCDALTAVGKTPTAWQLLASTAFPSWLNQVRMGATTIWERWDALREDGSLNPGIGTSFNHFVLGSVADWMHRVVAGLESVEPGYRTIRYAPGLVPLDYAAAEVHTPNGLASTRWTRYDGELSLTAVVPAGSRGQIFAPDGNTISVQGGTHTFRWRL